jgi:hypothetical protein
LALIVAIMSFSFVLAQPADRYPPSNVADIGQLTTHKKYSSAEVLLFTYSAPFNETQENSTATPAPTPEPTPSLPPCTTADPANATNCTHPTTPPPKPYLKQGAAFYPWVDIFVGLTIPGCKNGESCKRFFSSFFSKTSHFFYISAAYAQFRNFTEVGIELQIGNITSPRINYRESHSLHASSLAAAVNMADGVITSIEWDSIKCDLCDEQRCINSGATCANEDGAAGADGSLQQAPIYIYIAWVGTDSTGSPCQSLCKITTAQWRAMEQRITVFFFV